MIGGPVDFGSVYFGDHALNRLALHHPRQADRNNARELLRRSIELEPEMAAGLLGRQMSAVQDRYFLSPTRRGVFVLAESPNRHRPGEIFQAVVTYVRFGATQEATAWSMYPAAKVAA